MSSEAFFWLMAGLKVISSAPIQVRAVRQHTEAATELARQQRADDWLALAAMLSAELVAVFAGSGSLLSRGTYLVGSVLVAWLVQRTLQRLQHGQA